MNKLATAMQEGEYDAERPPSKVGGAPREGLPGKGAGLTDTAVCGRAGTWRAPSCLEGKKLDLPKRNMLVTPSPHICPDPALSLLLLSYGLQPFVQRSQMLKAWA